MNFINRIIGFLIFFIAFLLLIVLAVVPFEAMAWLQTQIGHLAQWAHQYQITNQLLFNLGRVALAAIASWLATLILTDTPDRWFRCGLRRASWLIVATTLLMNSGTATVSPSTSGRDACCSTMSISTSASRG
jgi:hypothetical protein